MESNCKLFNPKVTVDVYKQKRELVKQKPDSEFRVNASVEVIKDHLMKVKLRNGRFTIFSDEPPELGGDDAAPAMFEYFVIGAMLCECAQYIWNAVNLEIIDSIHKLEMDIEGGFMLAPLLGLTNDISPALQDLTVRTRIESDASPQKIIELARIAATRCPAHQSLRVPISITNVVELNGERITEFSDI